jgi:predicted DNA-binding transcriptional regulator AlpA
MRVNGKDSVRYSYVVGVTGRSVSANGARPRPATTHRPVQDDSHDSVSAPNSENMPEMLTAKELERLLKIDIKTIYSYVRRGLIPYVRIQSNVRFPKWRILEWIEQQSSEPKPTIHNVERN